MSLEVAKVFLTNEFISESLTNYNNSNTDVVIELNSGEKYIASFLTYQNIESLRKENFKSGDFLHGKYFWTKNIVLIDNCSKKSISNVVQFLSDNGDFSEVFKKI